MTAAAERTPRDEHRELALKIARAFKRRLPCNVLLADLEQAALIGLWDWQRRYPDERREGWAKGLRWRVRGEIVDGVQGLQSDLCGLRFVKAT